MDKFLNIKRKLDGYDENNGENKREKKSVTETINAGTQSSGASHKYHGNYLNYHSTDLIINHLIILKEKMKKYFPSLPIND